MLLQRRGISLFRNTSVTLGRILDCCNSDIPNGTRTEPWKANCESQVFSRTFLTTPTFFRGMYKVLYDGDCTLCQKEIRVLKSITDLNKKRVDFVDIASVEYNASDHQDVTYEMAMKEMHVIDPTGKVHSGAEAIRQMYEAVGLSFLASVTRLPGLNSLTDRMYVKFAEYRLQRALDNCDNGHCSVRVKHLRDMVEKERRERKMDATRKQ